MMTFRVKVKTSFFSKIYCGSFWGNFMKNLEYFLFEHLVALVGNHSLSENDNTKYKVIVSWICH